MKYMAFIRRQRISKHPSKPRNEHQASISSWKHAAVGTIVHTIDSAASHKLGSAMI